MLLLAMTLQQATLPTPRFDQITLDNLKQEMIVESRKKYLEKNLEVLVEEEKDGEYFGYSQNYLRVKFKSDEKDLINKLINIKIKCVENDMLIGEKEM